MTVDSLNLEAEVAIFYLLVALGEVALQFQKLARERVGLAFHLFEYAVVEMQNFIEVAQ